MKESSTAALAGKIAFAVAMAGLVILMLTSKPRSSAGPDQADQMPATTDVALPLAPVEQTEEEVKDWCSREDIGDPRTCLCGVERPSWTESQARQLGQRVSKDVVRDEQGQLLRVRVYDYFAPDNGDAFSGVSNQHVYYAGLEACHLESL